LSCFPLEIVPTLVSAVSAATLDRLRVRFPSIKEKGRHPCGGDLGLLASSSLLPSGGRHPSGRKTASPTMTRLAAEAKVVPDMGDGVMSVGEYYKDGANFLSNSIYKIYRSNSTRVRGWGPEIHRAAMLRNGAQDTIARPTGRP